MALLSRVKAGGVSYDQDRQWESEAKKAILMDFPLRQSNLDRNSDVVVFGGSGFVGSHLLESLATIGVRNLFSVDIKAPLRRIPGVQYVSHDVRKASDLDLPVASPIIFNFAAVHTTPGHDPWEYYEANVLGAIEVTRFAKRSDCRSIVFTSSISVYGPSEDPKSESSLPEPQSDYGRSKLMAEAIHRDWKIGSADRKLVVVRPAVVFGLGEGGNFTRLAKLLGKGVVFYPGRKDTIKSCIYVKDLIDWMIYSLNMSDSEITFNGSYSDRYTIEDIVETFKRIKYPKAKTVLVPATFLTVTAKVLQPLSKATGLGIHPDRVAKLMHSTNILPTWAEQEGLPTSGRLEMALSDWLASGGGAFG
jgi:nucleoside-diphosphate-sugar epimerase